MNHFEIITSVTTTYFMEILKFISKTVININFTDDIIRLSYFLLKWLPLSLLYYRVITNRYFFITTDLLSHPFEFWELKYELVQFSSLQGDP